MFHFQNNYMKLLIKPDTTVVWLRQSVATLSPQRLGSKLRTIQMGFVVDKVTLG